MGGRGGKTKMERRKNRRRIQTENGKKYELFSSCRQQRSSAGWSPWQQGNPGSVSASRTGKAELPHRWTRMGFYDNGGNRGLEGGQAD
ncbi:hypothetical protein AALO_G00083850 [Alosa alosa]|uniref:Uncharacterized protein n=1 Tax=Alosa alosa TaxID=278164 RepID=A0AAV6H3Q7_9TELE|nr:hypothetical protein AALO_G00083850 [Alosa alosa]